MARAYAHTNIALIKYWGKRTELHPDGLGLNLPAVGSLSLTLDRFGTETEVVASDADAFTLNGAEQSPDAARRVFAVLDVLRARAGVSTPLRVTSRNDVPTAAGLASSASGFCALVVAGAAALGVELNTDETAALARRGSGSAARSVYGGFVRLDAGMSADGADCTVRPLNSSLDVRLVVVRCAHGPKATASTRGMNHTAQTSPFYPAWVETHRDDLDRATEALGAGDLQSLGERMEHNTLKMHATTLSADPPFWYFNSTTLAVMDAVRALRADGGAAWFTMDAGPHVKVLCAPAQADSVARACAAVPGVLGVDVAASGGPARVLATRAASAT